VTILPCTLATANKAIAELHRHSPPVQGHLFSLALVEDSGELIGVAVIARPVCRHIDGKNICEVKRLCTNGKKNACSKLYSAAARAAKEMGFTKIQTYILDSEPGTTLKASGWTFEILGEVGNWTNRPNRNTELTRCRKQRWSKTLNPEKPIIQFKEGKTNQLLFQDFEA
jgi:hypothetical protein